MNSKDGKKYTLFNILLGFLLLLLLLFIFTYLYFMAPVGGNKKIEFVVNEGESTAQIASNLEKAGAIKNDKVFVIYTYLTNHRSIYAAKYDLNSNMKLKEVVDTLDKGGRNVNEITLTFKEGLNVRNIAKIISKNTNNSYDDVISVARDKKYFEELAKKYWFVDKNITKKNVYYYLEGYLFPDTYNFSSKDVSVKEIFDEMIKNMDTHLNSYKSSINKSKNSVFDILIIASLLELEGTDYANRQDIAGVFYNRLDAKMSLGSDVTTYYDAKKSMTSDLTVSELNSNNGYNTRASGMEGKLPIGPICNPSEESIKAVLNYSKHDYYYFVADKNGKIYLTKNFETHEKVINDLKSKGLWLEW